MSSIGVTLLATYKYSFSIYTLIFFGNFWYLFMHDWYSGIFLCMAGIRSRFSNLFGQDFEAVCFPRKLKLKGWSGLLCPHAILMYLGSWHLGYKWRGVWLYWKITQFFIMSTNNFAHVYHYLCRYVPSLNPTPIVLLEFFVVICMYLRPWERYSKVSVFANIHE